MTLNPKSQYASEALTVFAGAAMAAAGISGQLKAAETCQPQSPALAAGPNFVDEKLLRSDIRTDPTTATLQPGLPLTFTIHIQNNVNGVCTPLTGAYVDVWQANWDGIFSDQSLQSTAGQKFLRGYQVTDANGNVQFTTDYPGWYPGRTVNINVRVRTYNGATLIGTFDTQAFFNDTITDLVLSQPPYSTHGTRDTRNGTDPVYNSVTNAGQNQLALTESGTGYVGTLNLAVSLPTTNNGIGFAVPQFVSGGGWYTAIYLSNLTSAPAPVQVNFSDATGTPMVVTLTGMAAASSQTLTIAPNSTVELQAPNTSTTLQQGWADISVPAGVIGYGVFRQTVAGRPDQEAVVPLSMESSQAAEMIFDNSNTTTGLALANPTTQQVTVNIIAYNGNGTQVGSSTVTLAPRAQTAVTLTSLAGMQGLAGQVGRITLTTSSGAFSALGLRFGGSAFTSIPVTYR